MANLSITVEIKSVYGQIKVYPVCAKAKTFADIAGSKTLTRRTLRQIGSLGYEIIPIANADCQFAA